MDKTAIGFHQFPQGWWKWWKWWKREFLLTQLLRLPSADSIALYEYSCSQYNVLYRYVIYRNTLRLLPDHLLPATKRDYIFSIPIYCLRARETQHPRGSNYHFFEEKSEFSTENYHLTTNNKIFFHFF